MKKNMGIADRIIRLLIVLAIVALYFFKIVEGTWANVLLALAGIFLVTSLIGFCPAYSAFGIRTCSLKKNIWSEVRGKAGKVFAPGWIIVTVSEEIYQALTVNGAGRFLILVQNFQELQRESTKRWWLRCFLSYRFLLVTSVLSWKKNHISIPGCLIT